MDKELADTSYGQISEGRIDWCDIYKGIAIILVVVGHATGQFNQYIYQFHMAAFFFISGYTSKGRRGSVFEDIIKKFYKLMFPFYTVALAGISLFWMFNRAGVLNVISTTQYPGFRTAFMQLLVKRTVYCDWLGATWFLPALFAASIMFKILVKLCKNDYMLGFVGILLFYFSMKLAMEGISCYGLELAGIAQGYLVMGYLTKKNTDKISASKFLLLKILLVLLIWHGLFRFGFRNTVDWPSKSFNGFSDLFLPVCGIALTVNSAKLLAYSRHMKRLFVFLGQNSLGIMCFHFIGFKFAYLILVLLGKMQVSEMYQLVPPETVKNEWWILNTLIAIAVSLFLWQMLYKFSAVRFILGGENASKVYNGLLRVKPVEYIKNVYDCMIGTCQRAVMKPVLWLQKRKYYKAVVFSTIMAIFVIVGLIAYDGGKIKVTFPYWRNTVTFESGWFPQSRDEGYRWVEKKSEFQTYLMQQEDIKITGFIPDNVENMEYIAIKVNGSEAYRKSISSGQPIEIHLNISEYVESYRVNDFEIEMDGERIPKETDPDQRKFSAMINSILIF